MDKLLTESGLKALLSKHKVKDNGLQRALSSYEKLGDDEHDECLDHLAQIGKLAAALKKSKDIAANKDVVSYLEDLLDAADDEEKDVKKDQAAAAKDDKAQKKKDKDKDDNEEEDEDEEEQEEEEEEELEGDYATIMTTAMKKLKATPDLTYKFVCCVARPLPVVMIAKRVGSKHRKMMTEMSGGSKKFLQPGSCRYEDDNYIITLNQEVAGLARKVQKSLKDLLGKKYRIVIGNETAGDEEEGEHPEGEQEEQPQPRVVQGETPEEHEKPQEQPMEVLEDRRKIFKQARANWVQIKTKAEEDLEQVKNGAHEIYMHDAEQFPKIVKGCKDIDDIMDNLDDELRNTLDQYASTPLKNQARLHELATTAKETLDRYLQYVESNPVMKAIDQKEFADVVIHAPVTKALKDLRKALV